MKKSILILIIYGLSNIAYGQTIDKKWNVGLHGGSIQYNGDLGKGFYQAGQPLYGFGGISVSRYLAEHLDVNLLLTKGETGYTGSQNESAQSFHQSLNTGTLNLRFNVMGPEAFLSPYLFMGAGILAFDKNYSVDENSVAYAVPSFGGGLNIKLGPSVMFQIQELFILSDNDSKDGVKAGGNDMFLFHTGGLTFNFGKKLDKDSDGVADRKDRCPETPLNVLVDAKGCPTDKDIDGVPDYLDECPDVKGISVLNGCPDSDGDNIADKNDRCPDKIGTVNLKGCPDTDNDGVVDIDDNCAATDSKYKVDLKGCPMDNDGDGIFNEDDLCPEIAGIASLHGCNDTDADGVADNEDRCPSIKGTIANKGCPEMSKNDIIRITEIASKIFFETNSDKLKVASEVQLDDLAEILNRYPESNLAIEGHTDDVGDDMYNMTLSQKRTESVKRYLIAKGISENRLTAKGYGESRPIADNRNKMGRAKNRRVELKTSY